MTVTSGITLRVATENAATYGTAPTGSGDYTEVRMTSEDLSPNLEYTESSAIRSDGQITEMIRTDAQGGGSIAGELCYDSVFDTLSQASIASDTTTTVSAAVVSDCTPSAPTADIPGFFTAGSGTPFSSFTVGMWIVVSGGDAANRKVFKITKKTNTVIHVIGNTVTAGSEKSHTFTPLTAYHNGKTVQSFTLERQDADDTNEVERYTGMSVNSLELTVPTTGIITYSFGVEGKKPTSESSTAGSSHNDAATTSPMAAADVVQFWEGDTDLTDVSAAAGTSHPWAENPFQLLDFSLSITPNLRQRKTIGSIGPSAKAGRGDIGVTGSFRCYYNADADGSTATRTNKTLIDKALNDTATSLAIYVKDADGNGYIFDLPKVQLTSATHTTPGKSEDVIVEVEFQAYRNELDYNPVTDVTGTTIRIAKGTSLT